MNKEKEMPRVNRPITIYYLAESIVAEVKNKSLLEEGLSLSQLLRLLSLKFLNGDIKITEEDKKLVEKEV
jgi:hypothetical protein|tara:strand:+ start:410 stop:619 length:210 start_codon:yes stop_codon:yes gene_type:complete